MRESKFRALLRIEELKEEFIQELIAALSGDFVENVAKKMRLSRGHNREVGELYGLDETQAALVKKVEHMMNKGAGFKDVIAMLNSFKRGTKRLKTCQTEYKHESQYKWDESKAGNEKLRHERNLERAHFKWNEGNRYTLPYTDLNKIELLLTNII